MTNLPFKQKRKGMLLIREFSKDVDSSELVWHRDREDRYVTVLEGLGWSLQIDNMLPTQLVPSEIYYIPKNTYHRVLKGETKLVVEIREEVVDVKLTKHQLRSIIREQLALDDVVVVSGVEPRDFGYGEGEGRMTKSQLDKLARYSQSLHDKLHDDDNLPEWVQSKVAVAAENIGKVYHYLEYKMRRMEHGEE